MPLTTCRYCGADALSLRVAGRWLLFAADPVPTEHVYGVPAVVLSRTRGVLWAHSANPTPAECYPQHRCPQHEAERLPRNVRSLGDIASAQGVKP